MVQRGNLALYVLVLLSLYILSAFERRRRRLLAVALFGGLALLDLLWLGDWWGLPLAVGFSLLITAALGYLSLAHVLAGILANPG